MASVMKSLSYFFFIKLWILLFVFDAQAQEKVRAVEFSSPKEAKVKNSVRSYLSDQSEFNYFDEQVLNSKGSLFLYGLDQRFIELKYEGFSLEDNSNIEGNFDLSLLSRLGGLKVERQKSRSLNFKTSYLKNRLSAFYSSLNEKGYSLHYRHSNIKNEFLFSAAMAQVGNYNFSLVGSEKDRLDEAFLNLKWKRKINKKTQSESMLLLSGKKSEFDPFQQDSPVPQSEESYYLLGQKVNWGKNQWSWAYSTSNRIIKELFGTSSYRSNNFEAFYQYNKAFKVSFKNLQNKNLQDQMYGVLYQYRYFEGSLEKSARRGLYTHVKVRPFSFLEGFYQERPYSLFKKNWNELNGGGSLKKQSYFGIHFFPTFKIKKVYFQFETMYQRTRNQVEFDLSKGYYRNLSKVENFYAKLQLLLASYSSIFAQYQRVRDLTQNKDLPRRPEWVVGADAKAFYQDFHFKAQASWNHRSLDYIGQRVPDFWITAVELGYKSWALTATNVLNQDSPIFRDLNRRPFTLTLKYSYVF